MPNCISMCEGEIRDYMINHMHTTHSHRHAHNMMMWCMSVSSAVYLTHSLSVIKIWFSLFKFEGHLELIKFSIRFDGRMQMKCLFAGEFRRLGGRMEKQKENQIRILGNWNHKTQFLIYISMPILPAQRINRQHQKMLMRVAHHVNGHIRYCIRWCAAHQKQGKKCSSV